MACAIGPSVNPSTSSTDFFPSKTLFFGIYLNFQQQKWLKINISHILNPNLTKLIPLNPAHQDLSTNIKGTFQFLWNFQLRFNLIFNEEIIQYSKTSIVMEPSPCTPPHKSFPMTQRTRSEASQFNGSHNYKTKQTTFLHR